eukprot:3531852-Pleurochrysis_carterae.AAC.1
MPGLTAVTTSTAGVIQSTRLRRRLYRTRCSSGRPTQPFWQVRIVPPIRRHAVAVNSVVLHDPY